MKGIPSGASRRLAPWWWFLDFAASTSGSQVDRRRGGVCRARPVGTHGDSPAEEPLALGRSQLVGVVRSYLSSTSVEPGAEELRHRDAARRGAAPQGWRRNDGGW